MAVSHNPLKQKIEFVKGVGEARAVLLKKELGVGSIEDLIGIFPFRYDDRSVFSLLKDVRGGDSVQLKGTLVSLNKVKGRGRTRLAGLFKDPSGLIELTWFQGAKWIADTLKIDHEYILFGKVNVYRGKRTIPHPEMELASKAEKQSAFLPVYASTEALTKKNIGMRARRKIVQNIFNILRPEHFPEVLPPKVMEVLKLCSPYQAYRWIHFPQNETERSHAANRLKFEELFFLQLRILQVKKQREQKLKGLIFSTVGDYFNRFYKEKLPFELTGAQKRVSTATFSIHH